MRCETGRADFDLTHADVSMDCFELSIVAEKQILNSAYPTRRGSVGPQTRFVQDDTAYFSSDRLGLPPWPKKQILHSAYPLTQRVPGVLRSG